MSLLSLDVSRCVHTSNKFAICNSCVEACPVETIRLVENIISFTPSECVGCGGCNAVCPTSAYSLDDFSAIDYVLNFLESDKEIVSCKDNLPCIAALSVEELLSLVLLSENSINLDIGPCSECSIAQKNLPIIKERAQEVNFLLEAMMQTKSLSVAELNYAPVQDEKEFSRRDLLSKDGVKKAIILKQELENELDASSSEEKFHKVTAADIAKIKEKTIPQKRSLLAMAMKRASVPELFHTISIEDISFISQKDLDESLCTNCQMCYRICPTGALSSNTRAAIINFNPLSCVQCHSCHDVCEPNALTLRKTFSLSSFFEPKIETLVRFDMRRCGECNAFFAYNGTNDLCTRCQIEEDEARELWGIK